MTTAARMPLRVDVCIIGAGPAGSALAIRLAQLGHDVCLIERSAFPRSRIGESLSPGIWTQLELLGARLDIAAAGFSPCRTSVVHWQGDAAVSRELGAPGGLLVDRGRFDALLLDRARAFGVRVMQPAVVRARKHRGDGWQLDIESMEGIRTLDTRFLADASGRTGIMHGCKLRVAPRTFALYGYWRGGSLPREPRIEAGDNAWYWGVPLPDDTYNAIVFVDAGDFRRRRANSLDASYRALIGRSGLMISRHDAYLAGPVQVADATPYLNSDSVGPHSIIVGEAALALDPLSSSGVQKAVGTALTGAIVVNTLIRRPEQAEVSLRFYKSNLAESSDRHCRWAATHYALAASTRAAEFWKTRAAGAAAEAQPAPLVDANRTWSAATPVALSPAAAIVDEPCIVDEFVTVQPALRHPSLERPVVFLGGWKVASLLRPVRAGIALGALMDAWQVPVRSKPAIANWLFDRHILQLHRAT